MDGVRLIDFGFAQFVAESGVVEAQGTTPFFLEHLGLDSVHDLPPLGEFVPGAEVVEALERGLRGGSDLGEDGEPIDEPVDADEPSVAEMFGSGGPVEA